MPVKKTGSGDFYRSIISGMPRMYNQMLVTCVWWVLWCSPYQIPRRRSLVAHAKSPFGGVDLMVAPATLDSIYVVAVI